MRVESGQALIEAVAFFMTLILMVVCMLGFTKWFMVKQKMLMAVRQGALLYSSGRVTEEEVRQRLTQYLTSGSPSLVQNRLTIDVGGYTMLNPFSLNDQLDIVRIRYKSQSPWYSFTNLNPNLEEKCIIKHAATYGPGLQPFYGPPTQWIFASNVSD
jgi:hypothetical protein